ncbi:MAG: hypothetical protein AAGJ57_12950, partial [Pseudomonadota bacterium]
INTASKHALTFVVELKLKSGKAALIFCCRGIKISENDESFQETTAAQLPFPKIENNRHK